MPIGYTRHAEARIRHRNILKSDVEDTVLHPDIAFPSKLGRDIARKKEGEKYLKVIFEKKEE
jgi:hypothetical protein